MTGYHCDATVHTQTPKCAVESCFSGISGEFLATSLNTDVSLERSYYITSYLYWICDGLQMYFLKVD